MRAMIASVFVLLAEARVAAVWRRWGFEWSDWCAWRRTSSM